MIHFMVILLIGIAGASVPCDDAGRINCYIDLSQNPAIVSKETLCKQLPKTQQCVNNTKCPIISLDKYLESLIKSCDTECDLYKSIECSKSSYDVSSVCNKFKNIRECYSINKCGEVIKKNPDFFLQCGGGQTAETLKEIYGKGRLGKIFEEIKERIAKKKAQSTSTEQPSPSITTSPSPSPSTTTSPSPSTTTSHSPSTTTQK